MKKNLFVFLYIFCFNCIFSQETIKSESIPLKYDTSGYLENTTSLKTFSSSDTNDVVPTINAEMNVSNIGALVYTIPIEVINGINNFQPNIALSYNNQMGNGQAGWGWNIMGLSSITQGGTSHEIEGITRGSQFNDSDPFYLDGQRLMKTSDNTFETQIYSNLKIIKDSEGYSFIVKYPDGKVGKYKQLVYGQHYISVFSDAMDNEIHYEYTVSNNIPYVRSISYGNTSVNTDPYKIEFELKNRKFPIKSYRNGTEFINNKIISQIIVSSAYDGVYRKYNLTHDILSNQNERLRIVEIENKQGDKLKPLRFSYNINGASTQLEKNEIPNKGLLNPFVKSLGHVSIGDFHNEGKPYPIYNMETSLNGYKIIDPKSRKSLDINSDSDTQLFTGKTLLNNLISNNDQLIIINTEFTGDNYVNGYYTPKVKVKITTSDMTSNKATTVFFHTNGYYYQNTSPEDNKCSPPSRDPNKPSVDCYEYVRSKNMEEIVVGDFNNDGLTDILIKNEISSCNVQAGGRPYRIPGLNVTDKKTIYYFIEIGKIQTNGEITPEIFTSVNEGDLGTLIEFDGDGIPELAKIKTVRRSTSVGSVGYTQIEITKVNTINKTLEKIDIGEVTIGRNNKTVFWGDFNGDGLTDFISPESTYSFIDSNLNKEISAEEIMKRIDSENLIWNLFTNTGKGFIKTALDLTNQKLAYISPSQRNIVKKSSWWDKFWSGKTDKYKYTEYGTSYIIPTDFDNDGKMDLISIRKFTKLKQNDDFLNNLTIDNIDLSSPNANIITFHKSKIDQNGNISFVKLENPGILPIDIKNIKISPVSLLINTVEHNLLNSYQSGVIIHDPITQKDINISINNDDFTETHLKEIDNGSGVIQTVEYRTMIKDYQRNSSRPTNKPEIIYSVSPSGLEYPYYTQYNQGSYYFVHKLNTLFDNKSITTEYRYENGIQHLNGKGFIGFEKTFISDPYESEFINGKYYNKNPANKALFWKVNISDPLLDNSLKEATYGSLDYTNNASVFSRNITHYTKFNKGNHKYLILSSYDESFDYLKNVKSKKTYSYDTETLYLKEIYSEFYDQYSSSQKSKFSYKPDFFNGSHYFSGRIEKTEEILSRNGNKFSTKTESTYNNKGLISQSRKYGNDTSPIITDYTYDNFGNTLTETISSSHTTIAPLTTKYEYDTTHRYVIKITSPEGLISTKNIDTMGRLLSETSSLGLTTSYEYDLWNNPTKTTDYLGIISTLTKQNLSNGKYQLITQKEGESPVIGIFNRFDQQIQTRKKSLGKWVLTDIEYDIFGKVIRTSEPYFEGNTPIWNTTEYDELNRPIKQTAYTGKIISTCYEGLKITVEDGHRKTSKTLDVFGNVIEHNDSGGKIQYTYYPNGSLKEANYDGISLTMEQDGWGNRTKLTDPSSGTYIYEYDNFGNIIEEISPKGKTVYNYDKYGKAISEHTTGDHSSIIKNYTYNPITLLPEQISGSNNGKNYTYNTYYDQYYRIKGKKEITPYLISQSETSFDTYGRPDVISNQTYVSETGYTTNNKVKNVYNENGELFRQLDASDGNSLIWELKDLNSQGQSTHVLYGNNYNLYSTYTDTFLLQKTQHSKGTQSIINTEYTYNIMKGLLAQRNNLIFNKNEKYEYDDLDRLLKEYVNNALINEYTYDKRGRMTYNSNAGSYQYSDNNYQLNKITFNEKGVDLKNNRGFHQINYNSFKSPVEIYLPGKDRIAYEYGILKNRSAAFYGDISQDIVIKPNRKYYTSDGSAEVVKEGDTYKIISYINGDAYSANYIKIDILKGKSLTSSKKYFLHRDNQQSIIAITDAKTGTLTEQRYFDAWGNLTEVRKTKDDGGVLIQTSDFSLLIDRGYTGHEHLLSVGLIHMNGRLYDPTLRRFLSPDNFVQEPDNTQNYNRYGYVLNNPLLYIDPSGENGILIGVAIAVFANAINNHINKTPFWYGMGKSATIGAASSAISMGIGTITASMSGIGQAAMQAGMHGVSGGIMSSVDGGSFLSGFASGAVSSIVASGIKALGTNYSGSGAYQDQYRNYGLNNFGKSGYYKAVMIASGGLSGGISSSIAGGNFWIGTRQGLITSGLNHLGNHVNESRINQLTSKMETQLRSVDIDPDAVPKRSRATVVELIQKVPELKRIMNFMKTSISIDISNNDLGEQSESAFTHVGGTKITFYKNSFGSYLQLALTTGHELVHAYHYQRGWITKWENHYGNKYGQQNGKLMGNYVSEYTAWSWTEEWGYPGTNSTNYKNRILPW